MEQPHPRSTGVLEFPRVVGRMHLGDDSISVRMDDSICGNNKPRAAHTGDGGVETLRVLRMVYAGVVFVEDWVRVGFHGSVV